MLKDKVNLNAFAGLMSFNHKKLYPWDLKIGLNIKGNLIALHLDMFY